MPCAGARRMLKRFTGIVLPPNPDRTIAGTLKRKSPPQRFGLPPARTGNQRPDGTQPNHAPTLKLDRSSRADQEKVAPIAFLGEKRLQRLDIGRLKCVRELAEPGRDTTLRGCKSMRVPPDMCCRAALRAVPEWPGEWASGPIRAIVLFGLQWAFRTGQRAARCSNSSATASAPGSLWPSRFPDDT